MCCYSKFCKDGSNSVSVAIKLCKDGSTQCMCCYSKLCKDGSNGSNSLCVAIVKDESNGVCVAIVNSARMEVTVYVLI